MKDTRIFCIPDGDIGWPNYMYRLACKKDFLYKCIGLLLHQFLFAIGVLTTLLNLKAEEMAQVVLSLLKKTASLVSIVTLGSMGL